MHPILIKIITILIVSVNGQRFEFEVYGRVKTQFSECIEKSLRDIRDDLGFETVNDIVSFTEEKIVLLRPIKLEDLIKFIDGLKEQPFYRSINSAILRTQLISFIEKALPECYVKGNYDDNGTCKGSNHTERRCDVPRFPDVEAPELAEVLNFMLVDWPETLDVMINSRQGRSLLKKYVKDAQRALECALNLCNNNSHFFRAMIRTLWRLRAQIFFNYKNSDHPYVYHRYTENDRTPHTCGCATSIFSSQFWLGNEFERDPPASLQESNRIQNLHIADRPGCYRDDDIFALYQKFGMSASQYYLEKLIDQFYRIQFFFLELRARNIRTDEDDTYNGTLPYDRVPKDIQAIVYDAVAYSNYLLNLRKRLENITINTENVIRRNLVCTARPYEEDMFLLFNIALEDDDYSANISILTNDTIATTARSPTSSTTNPNSDTKGKGGRLYVNHCGRHFTNQPPTAFPQSCCMCENESKESDSSDFHMNIVNSCLRSRYNYTVANLMDSVFVACSVICTNQQQQKPKKNYDKNYGYIEDIDYKKLLLFKEDQSTFLKILQESSGLFSTSSYQLRF